MMLTFVRESLWISKVMKIPKPVKFEIINKNVILRITNLFKDQDISQAERRDRKEKEAEDVLGHSNIWTGIEGGGSKRHEIKYLSCIILDRLYSCLNMKHFFSQHLGAIKEKIKKTCERFVNPDSFRLLQCTKECMASVMKHLWLLSPSPTLFSLYPRLFDPH